jgi:hypothetical protein
VGGFFTSLSFIGLIVVAQFSDTIYNTTLIRWLYTVRHIKEEDEELSLSDQGSDGKKAEGPSISKRLLKK